MGRNFEVETACSDDELVNHRFLLMTLLGIRSETRLHCKSLFPTVVSYDITHFASKSVGKKGAKCVRNGE